MHSITSAKQLINKAKQHFFVLKENQISIKKTKPAFCGITFDGFSKYTYSEPAKHIAWNVFAKTGDIYVKNYEPKEEASITLMIDNHVSLNYKHHHISKFDLRNLLFAVLLITYIHFRKRVRVVFWNKDGSFSLVKYIKTERDLIRMVSKLFETPFHRKQLNKQSDYLWEKLNIDYNSTLIWLTDLSYLSDFNISNLRFQKKYVFRIVDPSEEHISHNRFVSNGVFCYPFSSFFKKAYQKKYDHFISKITETLRINRFQIIPFYTHKPFITSFSRFLKYV